MTALDGPSLGGPQWVPLHYTDAELVELGASPPTVHYHLARLAPFSGPDAGAVPGVVQAGDVAAAFTGVVEGRRYECSERTIRRCLQWLQAHGKIEAERTRLGWRVTVVRPGHTPRADKSVQSRAPEDRPPLSTQDRTTLSTQDRTTLSSLPLRVDKSVQPDRTNLSTLPSRGKNRDSESEIQKGGPPLVVQPPATAPAAPLTPPPVELDEEVEAAIRDAGRLLGHDVNDEVRKTLRSVLRLKHIPPGRRRRAAQDVAQSFVKAGGRFSDNAHYWGERLLNWVDPNRPAPRLGDAPPRLEVVPPPPPEAESERPPPSSSRAEIEAARALLKSRGLDKPNDAVRARYGVAS